MDKALLTYRKMRCAGDGERDVQESAAFEDARGHQPALARAHQLEARPLMLPVALTRSVSRSEHRDRSARKGSSTVFELLHIPSPSQLRDLPWFGKSFFWAESLWNGATGTGTKTGQSESG
jgi:hypothetical protein